MCYISKLGKILILCHDVGIQELRDMYRCWEGARRLGGYSNSVIS